MNTSPMSPSSEREAPIVDLVWGASGIAQAIGITTRQANNLLDRRIIPAKKLGHKWVISREALVAFFTQPDQKAA